MLDIEAFLLYNYSNKLEGERLRVGGKMKKRIAIITKNRILYQKIYLIIKDFSYVTDSADGADLVIFDIDSETNPPASDKLLTVGKAGADLLRPFSEEALLSAISGCGGAELSLGNRRAYLHGREIKLTEVEFDLLSRLVLAGGEFIPREKLLRDVWGDECEGGVLNVYIHYLREKLESEGEKIIFSSRKMGYKIDKKYLVEREDV